MSPSLLPSPSPLLSLPPFYVPPRGISSRECPSLLPYLLPLRDPGFFPLLGPPTHSPCDFLLSLSLSLFGFLCLFLFLSLSPSVSFPLCLLCLSSVSLRLSRSRLLPLPPPPTVPESPEPLSYPESRLTHSVSYPTKVHPQKTKLPVTKWGVGFRPGCEVGTTTRGWWGSRPRFLGRWRTEDANFRPLTGSPPPPCRPVPPTPGPGTGWVTSRLRSPYGQSTSVSFDPHLGWGRSSRSGTGGVRVSPSDTSPGPVSFRVHFRSSVPTPGPVDA